MCFVDFRVLQLLFFIRRVYLLIRNPGWYQPKADKAGVFYWHVTFAGGKPHPLVPSTVYEPNTLYAGGHMHGEGWSTFAIRFG